MPDKKPLVLHPFTFAVYPILFYYSLNKHEVWFSETLVPLVISLLVTIVLFLLFKLAFKSTTKSGIITSLTIILFYMYEVIQIGINDNDSVKLILDFDPNLFWTYGILLTLATVGLYFWNGKNQKITAYLNAVAFFLIVFPLFDLVSHKLLTPKSTLFAPTPSDRTAIPDNFNYIGPKPDIFYIIMDGYMRDDVMKEFWEFDNSAFIDYLKKRGFYVASKSRTNYPNTGHSLASSLNMDYLPETLGTDIISLMESVEKNKVGSFLKSIGYLYVHLSDDSRITKKNNQADIIITNRNYLSSFSRYLLSKTILKNLKIHSLDAAHYKKSNILYGFKKLEEIQKNDQPTFTFAHFLMPHSPQAFGKNGNAPNPNAPESDKYFDEVLYANKKIIRLVDHIFKNSKTLPIILIQGDHGALSHITNSPDGNMIKKQFSNLSAYHLPNEGKDRLYNTITPVNSFRLIFDRYFGTALGTLEDKSYLPSHTPRGKMITVPTEDSFNTNGLLAWIASLKRSILRKPDFAELHVLLGAYYLKLNYLPEAMTSLEKALSLNPNLPWAFINLGQVYAHSKHYAKGFGAVSKAIALNPKILEAYELLGKIQFEQGKYEEAILAINKVLKADPNRLVANDIAGKTYLLLNDKERALSYLKKRVLISPDFASYNDLGSAYAHFGQLEEAKVNWEKSLELNPHLIQAYMNLGRVYLKTKNYPKVIYYNQKIIDYEPDNLNAYINLGNTQLLLGKLDSAKATYETALLKHPEVAGIHKNLGIIYFQKNKNMSKAKSHFQKYLRLSPNQPDAAQIQSMIQSIENGKF